MSLSVLVVEDYDDLCAVIIHTLARRQYACESATTSEDAIGKLKTKHYGAILLAPRIPIKDDPVMRFLHESQPDCVRNVILMTSPGYEPEQNPHACRVLPKPFNHDELLEQLGSIEV
jgi:DNA-binding response OmpR family regulator